MRFLQASISKASAAHRTLRAARLRAQQAFRFGDEAPLRGERIWINPMSVVGYIGNKDLRYSESGLIRDGDWDYEYQILQHWDKYQACEARWIKKLEWISTGIFETNLKKIAQFGSVDGCRSLDELKSRYDELDKMYQSVCEQKILRSSCEQASLNFNASRDMLIHIGRGPRLFIGRGGQHRFAAAHMVGLRCVPAQIGVVHLQAIENWSTIALRSDRRPLSCS